ncbi:MAG: hypothetical protein RLZZ352_2254 [Pseudomonadota bacterium]|jgi:hypothetical protein
MIYSVTNLGLESFALRDGAINKLHKADNVKMLPSSRKPLIELFGPLPYTPEINPDKVLNRDLKTEPRSRAPTKDRFELRKLVRSFMEKLQITPGSVKNISIIR